MADRVNAIFLLFEEGVPEDLIVARVQELLADADGDEDRARFLGHLRIYADNVLVDEVIPEDIVDDDGVYARMRERGREYAPRLESLLRRLTDLSPL